METGRNKIHLFSLLVIGLLAFRFPANPLAQTQDSTEHFVEPCMIENQAFQAGEELRYKIYYNWNFIWLSAGEVVFKVQEKNGEYHISAKGETYPSYEWFFKVRDYYDTYVDKNSLLPRLSIRDVEEGKYRLYDKITFDQKNHLAKSLRGKSKEVAKMKEYKVEGCMHDILSIIYFARNVDFERFDAGAQFPIKIFMDQEVWPLNVKYHGKSAEKKIKGKGKFRTIQFSPEVIVGDVFKEGSQMSVWVSDDQNRIPLLIESPVSVGSVKVVLKEYSGLRYDLQAKVK